MTSITQSRDEFFAARGVEPCCHCLAREVPGTGIGPILADMLFEAYANAEIRRLDRLAERGAVRDDYDRRRAAENEAMRIRACWLADIDPEATSDDIIAQAA